MVTSSIWLNIRIVLLYFRLYWSPKVTRRTVTWLRCTARNYRTSEDAENLYNTQARIEASRTVRTSRQTRGSSDANLFKSITYYLVKYGTAFQSGSLDPTFYPSIRSDNIVQYYTLWHNVTLFNENESKKNFFLRKIIKRKRESKRERTSGWLEIRKWWNWIELNNRILLQTFWHAVVSKYRFAVKWSAAQCSAGQGRAGQDKE